jgi:hypothetical protein
MHVAIDAMPKMDRSFRNWNGAVQTAGNWAGRAGIRFETGV